jgi:hypothetical protein
MLHWSRDDVRAEIRPLRGKGDWTSLRPVSQSDSLRTPLTAAGRYLLRVRGPLGLPRTREIELPEAADSHIAVEIGGGSGIRVVERGRGGNAPERISFRLTDAEGAPVGAEYADPRLDRQPTWAFDGPDFSDVPNGGILRLDPGDYRIAVLVRSGGQRSFDVHAYPGVITRLEAKKHRVR